MFLDYLKATQITYNATRRERLRYRGHFKPKWKDPTNPGNMSCHEHLRDAVGQRAFIQSKGLDKDPLICNYVLNSETNANNGVICALSSVENRRCRRHRHRQRLGGIRDTGKSSTGEDEWQDQEWWEKW